MSQLPQLIASSEIALDGLRNLNQWLNPSPFLQISCIHTLKQFDQTAQHGQALVPTHHSDDWFSAVNHFENGASFPIRRWLTTLLVDVPQRTAPFRPSQGRSAELWFHDLTPTPWSP